MKKHKYDGRSIYQVMFFNTFESEVMAFAEVCGIEHVEIKLVTKGWLINTYMVKAIGINKAMPENSKEVPKKLGLFFNMLENRWVRINGLEHRCVWADLGPVKDDDE